MRKQSIPGPLFEEERPGIEARVDSIVNLLVNLFVLTKYIHFYVLKFVIQQLHVLYMYMYTQCSCMLHVHTLHSLAEGEEQSD